MDALALGSQIGTGIQTLMLAFQREQRENFTDMMDTLQQIAPHVTGGMDTLLGAVKEPVVKMIRRAGGGANSEAIYERIRTTGQLSPQAMAEELFGARMRGPEVGVPTPAPVPPTPATTPTAPVKGAPAVEGRAGEPTPTRALTLPEGLTESLKAATEEALAGREAASEERLELEAGQYQELRPTIEEGYRKIAEDEGFDPREYNADAIEELKMELREHYKDDPERLEWSRRMMRLFIREKRLGQTLTKEMIMELAGPPKEVVSVTIEDISLNIEGANKKKVGAKEFTAAENAIKENNVPEANRHLRNLRSLMKGKNRQEQREVIRDLDMTMIDDALIRTFGLEDLPRDQAVRMATNRVADVFLPPTESLLKTWREEERLKLAKDVAAAEIEAIEKEGEIATLEALEARYVEEKRFFDKARGEFSADEEGTKKFFQWLEADEDLKARYEFMNRFFSMATGAPLDVVEKVVGSEGWWLWRKDIKSRFFGLRSIAGAGLLQDVGAAAAPTAGGALAEEYQK
jgi:hypothetical protein